MGIGTRCSLWKKHGNVKEIVSYCKYIYSIRLSVNYHSDETLAFNLFLSIFAERQGSILYIFKLVRMRTFFCMLCGNSNRQCLNLNK